MDLKEGTADEARGHWYYVSKGRAVRKLLGGMRDAEVLDVGAGSGVFSRQLIEAGVAGRATCVDPNYTDDFIAAHERADCRYVRAANGAEADLMLFMDVIEHVDDDRGLLAGYLDHARRGAKVLVTVPAFQFLWSGHDEYLEHRRRYTVDGLTKAVADAGLRPLRSAYFFGALFPGVAAARIASKVLPSGPPTSAMRTPRPAINRALTGLHDLERMISFPANRLAGVSAFCLAERA